MLALCSQIDLDNEVAKAARRLERDRKATGKSGTLLPAAETIPGLGAQPDVVAPPPEPETGGETPEEEASRVFAQLKELSRPEDDKEDNKEDAQE